MEDTCVACGERNPVGTQFCLFCGAYLEWDEATAPAATEEHRAALQGAAVGAEAGSATEGRTPRAEVSSGPVSPCPACGAGNDPGRRFCSRCATTLRVDLPVRPEPTRREPWWRRVTSPEDRAARRRYRRSLPPFYRWRRVAVVGVVLAMTAGVLVATRSNPWAYAVTEWHELRKDVVVVEGVAAQVVPATAATDSPASGAVDGSPGTAWTSPWRPPATAAECGVTSSPALFLTFPAARVRRIDVVSGSTSRSGRALQLLPRTLNVTTSAGGCFTVQLSKADTPQRVEVDTSVPVTSLTIAVASTYPGDERARSVVSLSELTLYRRPG